MTTRLLLTRRIVQLLIGLFLYGIAISLMVRAGIGVSPWDVLAQGLSLKTGIEFGWVTNLIGLVVLAFWIPLRQKPGLGTILNVLLVGPSAQLGLDLLPQQTELWAQVLFFAAGLVLLAVATGLYIGPRLGPGPRDGLMTGLHARTGRPIWMVRTAIEVTVLIVGWALGGNVGIGTLAFALLVGPLCSITLPFFAIRLPQDAATAAAGLESELEGTAEQSAGLEGEQDAVRFDVRDGILLESDRAAHDRFARPDSPFVRAPQPDREPRAPREPSASRASRPSRVIAAHWLDDRITRRPRHP
ncbi:YczE/YyaS/YitT family protein [Leifsonia virtsii]|uniref:YitT family protein n=1 Tax=Leifsonia virtsii TaxID=3035915 RepID=A0ABT8IW08_9MICO|nr:YitT family protein [Leifsonia virtsii]MDN4597009.1 YitT family protein [Leifsonia virtsii]